MMHQKIGEVIIDKSGINYCETLNQMSLQIGEYWILELESLY